MSEHTFEDSIREIESMEPLDEWRARIDRELRNAGLTEAWNEAEAALPEGWRITSLERSWDMRKWAVLAQSRRDWEDYEVTERADGDGPTPAAALRALTVKLQEART